MITFIGNLPTSRFIPIRAWSGILGPLAKIPTACDLGRDCYAAVLPFSPRIGCDRGRVYYGAVFVHGDHMRLESYGDSRREARRWLEDTFVSDCIVSDVDEFPFAPPAVSNPPGWDCV